MSQILLLVAANLILTFVAWGQSPREVLLTADNAYNPIPSPDGRYVAYVRTGWGEKWWGGFGRASLVSEVKLVNIEGVPASRVLAEDFFLSGWTPDSMRVVCYRDWKYALVSKEGKKEPKGQIPNDPNHPELRAEWVAYAPSFATLIWSRAVDESHRAIETPDRVVMHTSGFSKERVAPSPDGRYLAVFGESSQPHLRIYDLQLESWTDLGLISIHPDKDWSYIQPDWNPWFADGSRLVFVRESAIVIAKPDGITDSEIKVNGRAGLPTASPDGKMIAFVTFEPSPRKIRSDLQFWGSTTIWVTLASGASEFRHLTAKNQDEVLDLKWLNNDAVVFDRIADEPFYSRARIWKAALTH